MQAITIPKPGGPDSLVFCEIDDVVPGDGEVLIEVAAAGVNRADIGQRQGNYPPPPGASTLPGLEVSGTIVAFGRDVERGSRKTSDDQRGWAIGDRVAALLPGGGYASLVTASPTQLLRVDKDMDLVNAAALPEALATVWSNLFMLANLRAGETLLIHGGSSGIGTIAIQLARASGVRVAVTTGSAAKLTACATLGADILINYREDDFVARILDETKQRGVEVILDAIGGSYLERNLTALAPHGRLVNIGNLSGEKGTVDFRALMGKWLSVFGTTLRARSAEEKNNIMASVRKNVWPLIEEKIVLPVVDARFALADAAAAHRRMESSEHIGKLLLIP